MMLGMKHNFWRIDMLGVKHINVEQYEDVFISDYCGHVVCCMRTVTGHAFEHHTYIMVICLDWITE
jgi:hypothetical protein